MNGKVWAVLVVLAGGLGLWLLRGKPSSVTHEVVTVSGKEHSTRPALALPKAGLATEERLERIRWRSIESEELSRFISNLRGIGCDERTIHDLVRARLNRALGLEALYAEQRKAAANGANLSSQQALAKRIQPLEDEFERQWRQLFGMDSANSVFAGLSAEVQVEARKIVDEFGQKLNAIRARSGQFLQGEDRVAAAKLEAERLARLTEIVGAEKAFAICAKDSSFAPSITTQLAGMTPTDEELRAVYRLRLKYADGWNPVVNTQDGKELEALAKRQREMETELKAEIGEKRFSEYLETKRGDFRAAFAFTSRNGLDRQVAVALTELQRAYERPDPTWINSSSARQATVESLRKNLVTILGEKGLASYATSEGGWVVSWTNRVNLPGAFPTVGRPLNR